jgi:hypothetical protein
MRPSLAHASFWQYGLLRDYTASQNQRRLWITEHGARRIFAHELSPHCGKDSLSSHGHGCVGPFGEFRTSNTAILRSLNADSYAVALQLDNRERHVLTNLDLLARLPA